MNNLIPKLCLMSAVIPAMWSCSSGLESDPDDGTIKEVKIRATLPSGYLQSKEDSRAYGDGARIKSLTYAVYAQGQSTPDVSETRIDFTGNADLTLRLASGRKYTLVFWADSYTDNSVYTFDSDNATISVNYAGAAANDESRDAFFASKEITIGDASVVNVELRRPFAQINVATADAKIAGIPQTAAISSSMSLSIPSVLDLKSGTVSDPVEVTFAEHAMTSGEAFPTGADMTYLGMNYILAADESLANISFTASADSEKILETTFSGIPLKRNYQTNISGNLLSDETSIKVVVAPGFNGEAENGGEPESGEPSRRVNSDGTSTYLMKSADDLRWVSEQSASNPEFWNQNSIDIVQDIDLSAPSTRSADNYWTPINISSANRRITINGNGRTVSHITMNPDGSNDKGLFGRLEGVDIVNLNVSDVTYTASEGNNIGGLVGYTTGKITGSKASKINITVGNGKNIGAIAGCVSGMTQSDSDFMLSSTVVTESNIHGHEAIGAVAGCFDNVSPTRAAIDYFVVNDQTITNTTVTASDANPGLLAGESTDQESSILYANVSQSGNSTDVYLGKGKAVNRAGTVSGSEPKYENGTYQVYNSDQLTAALERLQSGETISLMADIDYHGLQVLPINLPVFNETTTINGNTHTIRGASIRETDPSHSMAFLVSHYMDDNGTRRYRPIEHLVVKDLTIDNFKIEDFTINKVQSTAMSAIFAYALNGDLSNVKFTNCSINTPAAATIGIIASKFTGGTLSNCTIENCSITALYTIGCMFGQLNTSTAAVISDCTLKSVTLSPKEITERIGRIAGSLAHGSAEPVVTNLAVGEVTATNNFGVKL